MKLSLVSTSSLAALLVVVAGCGRAAVSTSAPPSANAGTPDVAQAALAGKKADKATVAAAEEAPGMSSRHPGDFVVFKFSGAFHKGPMTLTERVVAKEGTTLVVDYTLSETVATKKGTATKDETLRVKIDQRVGGRGEIFGVHRIENGVAKTAELKDWEAMIGKTVLVADENEQTLGSEDVAIDVGGRTFEAQKTSYKVLFGKKSATMTITQSEGFAWGDLGGEIVGSDGTLLYKAEIVEAGTAPAPFVAVDED